MQQRDKLRLTWSKTEKDLMCHFPAGTSTKSDAYFLNNIFSKEVTDSLIARGYDLSTIKFEISPSVGNVRFVSQRPPV